MELRQHPQPVKSMTFIALLVTAIVGAVVISLTNQQLRAFLLRTLGQTTETTTAPSAKPRPATDGFYRIREFSQEEMRTMSLCKAGTRPVNAGICVVTAYGTGESIDACEQDGIAAIGRIEDNCFTQVIAICEKMDIPDMVIIGSEQDITGNVLTGRQLFRDHPDQCTLETKVPWACCVPV